MKNKKIIIIFLILFIILIIGGYFLINYLKKVNVKDQTIVEEYTPEEEISEDQLRQTIVSLYFQNKAYAHFSIHRLSQLSNPLRAYPTVPDSRGFSEG